MIRQQLRSLAATWLAGLLVLLPLAITFGVLAWLVGLLNRLLGPDSSFGKLFGLLGYPIARDSNLAYFFGILILVGVVYLLGLIARTSWHASLQKLAQRVVLRIPVLGPLYGAADRIVGLLGQKQGSDMGAMKPVWCSLGGGSTMLLALAPSGEAVLVQGRQYMAVLVPTAPVPVGGALLYVPLEDVSPANISIEQLSAVYVSMGLSMPKQAGGSAIPAA